MLYKVYVNLCDFRVGSYMTLRTKAAQFLLYKFYMPLGWSMRNIFAFSLRVHQNIFKKFPLFWPLSGGWAIYDPRNFICKLESPCPKVASYQIMHLGNWIVRGIFFRYQKFPLLYPLSGPQKGPASWFAQTLISIPQWCFLPNLVQISSLVLESEHFKCFSLYKPM